MRRHPFPLWLVPLACLLGNSAEAQDRAPRERVLEEARAEFVRGVEHADAGRWERALRAFRQVAEVMPAPPVRFNLATALLELRQFPEAGLVLEELVGDPEATPEVREAAAERLDAMVRASARARFRSESAEAVLVDGFAIGPEHFERGVLLSPGAHLVEAYRGGEIASRRRIEAIEGREVTVAFADSSGDHEAARVIEVATPQTGPSEGARARPAWLRHKWVWIGVSAAAVLGIGLGAGLAARSNRPHVGNFEPGQLRW